MARKSPLTPLAPLFSLLNWVAFAGWSYVLVLLVSTVSADASTTEILDKVEFPVMLLEGICILEVVRIVLGDLPGNLVLGVILHLIRLTAITQVLPRAPEGHWAVPAVLCSWCLTEITRYPMYILPSSDICRSVRMVVPLFTFPVGCAAEAYGAYLVFVQEGMGVWLKAALAIMLFVNGVLGPTMACPALLKKGLPVLGLAKKPEKKEKKVKMF